MAWGQDLESVRREAETHSRVEVVTAGSVGSASKHRNLGLAYASKFKPKHVAFIDDDTFLDKAWHFSVARAAQMSKGQCSVGGIVMFASDWSKIQSGGHVFTSYRPRDIGYGADASEDLSPQVQYDDPDTFTCPCANSAFVSWTALETIRRIDGAYWDERFPRLTCFELGFKLHRLGQGYVIAPGALAAHDGYLHRKALRKHDAVEQLLSRMLLYRKFLPAARAIEALQDLDARVVRWATHGYPSSRLNSREVVDAYNEALALAEQCTFDEKWRTLIATE